MKGMTLVSRDLEIPEFAECKNIDAQKCLVARDSIENSLSQTLKLTPKRVMKSPNPSPPTPATVLLGPEPSLCFRRPMRDPGLQFFYG